MALLLRHSRKLPRVHGVLDHFSAGACSSVVKEDMSQVLIFMESMGKELEAQAFSKTGSLEKSFRPSSSHCERQGEATLPREHPSTECQLLSIVCSHDLPPHQEIGMPSLSPTMTEGNIARWLKKEGDKVSPGEVLCEVETDKATVEMESMEEGYLTKIIHGDGAKEINVGELQLNRSPNLSPRNQKRRRKSFQGS